MISKQASKHAIGLAGESLVAGGQPDAHRPAEPRGLNLFARVLRAAIAIALLAFAYRWLALWSRPGVPVTAALDRLFLLMVVLGVSSRLWVRRFADWTLAVVAGSLLGGMWLETVSDVPCDSLLCLLFRALDAQWVILVQVVVYTLPAGLAIEAVLYGWKRFRTRAPVGGSGA